MFSGFDNEKSWVMCGFVFLGDLNIFFGRGMQSFRFRPIFISLVNKLG